MIQKITAMGNWWLTALSLQHAYLCIMSCAEIFDKTSNHPGNSVPLHPRFGALWLLAFPKTKITFEREEISDHWWDSEKYDRAADGNWENCVRSKGAYFEGDWGVTVLYTMFLVSRIFFNKCLYFFHATWLDTFWNWIDLVKRKKNLTFLGTIREMRLQGKSSLWKLDREVYSESHNWDLLTWRKKLLKP